MGTRIAIIVGAALIAAAILLTNHWQMQPAGGGTDALRLNRWTGTIDLCMLDPKSIKEGASSLAGVQLACEAQ